MKTKLLLSLIATLLLGTLGFAENAQETVVISANKSGTLLPTPKKSTDYVIEINEGVTFTNTGTRIIGDIANDGCNYKITGDGNLVVSGSNSAHAVIFGAQNTTGATPNSSIIVDVDTTINTASAGGNRLTLTNQITTAFYKNLNASEIYVSVENNGVSNLIFGEENATSKYTASLANVGLNTNNNSSNHTDTSLNFTVNKNYTVNVVHNIYSKSITINGGNLTGKLILTDAITMNGGSINLTSSVSAKSVTVNGGTITANAFGSNSASDAAVVKITSGSISSSEDLYVSGNSLVEGGTLSSSKKLGIVQGASLVQKGGKIHGSHGLHFTGATYEYHGGTGPSQIITSGGTVKLYNNFSTGLIKVNGANSLDLYWNGFETILKGNTEANYQGFFTDGNENAIFNLIVEEGYSWENDKLFVGNITEEQLYERIGRIQVGDVIYEKGEWFEVLELVSATVSERTGYYINLATVPEPAEWAMIFGAIALAFVVYRRK